MMKSLKLDKRGMDYFIENSNNLQHESPHQYEKVRINDDGIIFILYNSGSLVYEDNHKTRKFMKRHLKDISNDNISESHRQNNHNNKAKKISKKNNKNGQYSRNRKHRGYAKEKNINPEDNPTSHQKEDRYYTSQTNPHKKRYPTNREKDKHHENEYDFNNNDISLSDYDFTIGSDETGKGEWFGPLVVCAVATSKSENLTLRYIGVKDSKELTKKQIEEVYERIEKLNIKKELIVLKPFSYNKLYSKFKDEGKNLNHMLAYLHTTAIKRLLENIDSTDTLIIIDKFDAEKVNQYMNARANMIQIENGERFIPVAASSIIAKYHYEKVLNELEERYNIRLNKKTKIKDIDKQILDKVAKTHFKNVAKYAYQ